MLHVVIRGGTGLRRRGSGEEPRGGVDSGKFESIYSDQVGAEKKDEVAGMMDEPRRCLLLWCWLK
jgi:hypothetical protein